MLGKALATSLIKLGLRALPIAGWIYFGIEVAMLAYSLLRGDDGNGVEDGDGDGDGTKVSSGPEGEGDGGGVEGGQHEPEPGEVSAPVQQGDGRGPTPADDGGAVRGETAPAAAPKAAPRSGGARAKKVSRKGKGARRTRTVASIPRLSDRARRIARALQFPEDDGVARLVRAVTLSYGRFDLKVDGLGHQPRITYRDRVLWTIEVHALVTDAEPSAAYLDAAGAVHAVSAGDRVTFSINLRRPNPFADR